MYINISVNNGNEKLTKKKYTANFSTLIIAVYSLVVCIYISCIFTRSARV